MKLSATDTLINAVTPGEEMEGYWWKKELVTVPAGVDRTELACRLSDERQAIVRLYGDRLLVETLQYRHFTPQDLIGWLD